MKVNPMTCCDYYKLGHMTMDVPGVKRVISTWTPRQHKHDKKENEFTVHFGSQYVVRRYFKEFFEEFFANDFQWYDDDFTRKITSTFNPKYIDPICRAFKKLHKLGYLPIEVWALPEGTLVADGCPSVMMWNTNDEFGWLPQFLEDLWSLSSWMPSTSATTAYYRRKAAIKYFENGTYDQSAIRRLCGDFSMRGMTGHEAAAISGAAHLLSFDRTATIDANSILEQYYGADLLIDPPGYGLPSLEHSVVEKGVAYFLNKVVSGELINDDKYGEYIHRAMYDNWEPRLIAEMCFMIYVLTEVQPEGNFTYVSDTYDYWGVITKILPMLVDVIKNRNGKLIIRPDSGTPEDIILGTNRDLDEIDGQKLFISTPGAGSYAEQMGTLYLLGDIFGYSLNGKDRKVLNPHIGLIYGDAITAERQETILAGLEKNGWAPENIALGIGAFTYQFATRDTRGFAIKAVGCTLESTGEINIFKEPKTDPDKKSQRGAVIVYKSDGNMATEWSDGGLLSWATTAHNQALRPIFKDGNCINEETIYEIRDRLWNGEF